MNANERTQNRKQIFFMTQKSSIRTGGEFLGCRKILVTQDGYDIFLVLEATIGVNRIGEKASGNASSVTSVSMGNAESQSWVGKNVRVAPTKPDGSPNPSAGKTGTVLKLLPLGAQMRAVVEVDNDFILVPVESIEVLQPPPTRSLPD